MSEIEKEKKGSTMKHLFLALIFAVGIFFISKGVYEVLEKREKNKIATDYASYITTAAAAYPTNTNDVYQLILMELYSQLENKNSVSESQLIAIMQNVDPKTAMVDIAVSVLISKGILS